MSILAHAVFAAPGLDTATKRRELDRRIQFEIREAKRIQRAEGVSWSEALRLARHVGGGPQHAHLTRA